MATPMHVYEDIASRYGVDPSNQDAVDDFFDLTVPTLPEEIQISIKYELLARETEIKIIEEKPKYSKFYTAVTIFHVLCVIVLLFDMAFRYIPDYVRLTLLPFQFVGMIYSIYYRKGTN